MFKLSNKSNIQRILTLLLVFVITFVSINIATPERVEAYSGVAVADLSYAILTVVTNFIEHNYPSMAKDWDNAIGSMHSGGEAFFDNWFERIRTQGGWLEGWFSSIQNYDYSGLLYIPDSVLKAIADFTIAESGVAYEGNSEKIETLNFDEINGYYIGQPSFMGIEMYFEKSKGYLYPYSKTFYNSYRPNGEGRVFWTKISDTRYSVSVGNVRDGYSTYEYNVYPGTSPSWALYWDGAYGNTWYYDNNQAYKPCYYIFFYQDNYGSTRSVNYSFSLYANSYLTNWERLRSLVESAYTMPQTNYFTIPSTIDDNTKVEDILVYNPPVTDIAGVDTVTQSITWYGTFADCPVELGLTVDSKYASAVGTWTATYTDSGWVCDVKVGSSSVATDVTVSGTTTWDKVTAKDVEAGTTDPPIINPPITGIEWIDSIITAIVNAFNNLLSWLSDFWNNLKNFFSSFWNILLAWLASFFEKLGELIKSFFIPSDTALNDFFESINVFSGFSSVLDSFSTLYNSLVR